MKLGHSICFNGRRKDHFKKRGATTPTHPLNLLLRLLKQNPAPLQTWNRSFRIWKNYISEIDSCVGAALLKGCQVDALAKVLKRADLGGEDREVISDYAEIPSGQIRELINAVDEINRYLLPGEMFRERVR